MLPAMKPGIDALQSLALFAAWDRDLLARLNDIADLARVGPDEVLFHEGALLGELTFLVSGRAAAVSSHPSGGEALTDALLPVQPLCLSAVLLGQPTPFGARTVTSARLIILPAAELSAMVRNEPALALPFLDHAMTEVQQLTLTVCDLKLRSSPQRLAEYLLSMIDDQEQTPARFVLPFEKRLLAARIGCSQENLSRAFAALRRFGVRTQRGAVVLPDVAGLKAFCGLPRQTGQAPDDADSGLRPETRQEA